MVAPFAYGSLRCHKGGLRGGGSRGLSEVGTAGREIQANRVQIPAASGLARQRAQALVRILDR